MASPIRKPDAEHGSNPPTELAVVRAVELGVPKPPSGVLKATRVAWEGFWGSDVARLVDSAADMPALVRLFRMYDESERAYRAFTASEAKGGGRVVAGSKGQPVQHPALREWQDLMKAVVPLEDRFGITPRGRLSLGIKLGDAAASLEKLNAQWAGDDPEVIDID